MSPSLDTLNIYSVGWFKSPHWSPSETSEHIFCMFLLEFRCIHYKSTHGKDVEIMAGEGLEPTTIFT